MKTMNLLAVLLILAFSVPAVAQKKTSTAKKFSSCLTKMPQPSFSFDTTKLKGRGLADNYFLWDNGKEIYVKFMSGSPAMQKQIMAAAKEWEKYANLKFKQVTSGPAQIRILLTDEDGYYSMVGSQASMIPEEEQTMNFDTTGNNFKYPVSMKGTVIHEFGHAIGLLHEHSSPVSGIQWDKEKIYSEYAEMGWDRDMVDAQVFEAYHVSYTNGTMYDNKSIMHYPIDPNHTKNKYKVDWNFTISEGDKQLVSLLYPKAGERKNEVARFTVSDYTKMEIVNGADKLSMYPSFVLNTAGKSGTVYFIVFLYDENGNPIIDNDDKYNINGVVGTYDGGLFQPGKRLGANKNGKDFELSIPHNQIPLPNGSKVQAVFRTYLFNDLEELKLLYSSSPVTFNLKKSGK